MVDAQDQFTGMGIVHFMVEEMDPSFSTGERIISPCGVIFNNEFLVNLLVFCYWLLY